MGCRGLALGVKCSECCGKEAVFEVCGYIIQTKARELDMKLLMGISQKYDQLTGEMTTVEEQERAKCFQVEGEGGEASQAALHCRARSSLFLNLDDGWQ